MENSYQPGAFTIELNDKCYPIAHDMTIRDSHVRSALLHEYMHYLQDTVTYYGVKYRGECYFGNIDKQIAGGNDCSSLGYPYMGDTFVENDEGRLLLDGEVVGATAIKENMARQAELYVFGELKGATYNAMTYKAITLYAKCFSMELSQHYLAMFVIDDCCLGTSDPSKAIVMLLHSIDIDALHDRLNLKDQELVPWLYAMIYGIFNDKGILVDQAVDTAQFDTKEWKVASNTSIARQFYPTEDICFAHEDEVMALINKIKQSYYANATLRQSNQTVLADSLMLFKQDLDFSQLFSKFGLPIIKKAGTCDTKHSNLDIILQ